MKKFVLVPYAQFQRDKRRAEETLEKEQVPNFEKRASGNFITSIGADPSPTKRYAILAGR